MSETRTPTVHEAWANVMADVRALGKDQRNSHQGFNFRGVDDAMNAVGPVLRKHGVMVVPTDVDLRNRDTQTSNGKPAHEATVVVRYTIYGPAGDSMPGAAAGESLDSGDKATPKAMSVAYRTFLLQALTLPTQQTDPDAETYERSSGPTPQQMADQVAAGIGRVQDAAAMHAWCAERNLLGLLVTDPQRGDGLTLAQLLDRRAAALANTEAVA